ncbi:hypothetical protein MBLNU457_5268t1 [Dothideomycetes sp. NU457]
MESDLEVSAQKNPVWLFLQTLKQWHRDGHPLPKPWEQVLQREPMYESRVRVPSDRLPMHVDGAFLQDVLVLMKTVDLDDEWLRRHACPNGFIDTKVLAFGDQFCIFLEARIMYDTESSSTRYFCINVKNPGVVILKLLSLEGPLESRPSHEELRKYRTQPIFDHVDDNTDLVLTDIATRAYPTTPQGLEKTIIQDDDHFSPSKLPSPSQLLSEDLWLERTRRSRSVIIRTRHILQETKLQCMRPQTHKDTVIQEDNSFPFPKLPFDVQDLFYELLLDRGIYVVDCADRGTVSLYMEDLYMALTRRRLATFGQRFWAQFKRACLRSVPIVQLPWYNNLDSITDETWHLLSHFKHIKVLLADKYPPLPILWCDLDESSLIPKIISTFNAHLPRLKALDIIVPLENSPSCHGQTDEFPTMENIHQLSYHERLIITMDIWIMQEITYTIPPSVRPKQSSSTSLRRRTIARYSRWPPTQWGHAFFHTEDTYTKYATFSGLQFPIAKLRKLRSCAMMGTTSSPSSPVPVTLFGHRRLGIKRSEYQRFTEKELRVMERVIPRKKSRPVYRGLETRYTD